MVPLLGHDSLQRLDDEMTIYEGERELSSVFGLSQTDLRDVSDAERRSIQDARKMQGLSNSSEVDYLVGDESEAQSR